MQTAKTLVAILTLAVVMLTGCNAPEKSWYEKQIEALHYKKLNKEIDFATKIKNQKECEEYGKKNWKETADNGDWHSFDKFMYSPVYDKCFSLRTADNYKEKSRMVIIFDLLSGTSGGIFTYKSWCRDWYKENGIQVKQNDLEKECPTEHQIADAWLSLLGEHSN